MTTSLFRVFLLVFISAVGLTGCVSAMKAAIQAGGATASIVNAVKPSESGKGGYYMDDGPPESTPDNLMDVPDAVPKVEPYPNGPNRPYVVFGKRYVPITDNRPYKERGYGSWYGKKFHGRLTSSGEPYDMFKMTAAHPTLPIPCYVRVTCVNTGAQIIVRINDRGPFHSGRIIDLSYTAALKLGYLHKGSGMVEVEFLQPEEIRYMAQASSGQPVPTKISYSQTGASNAGIVHAKATQTYSGERYYIQLGAYQNPANAEFTQAQYALDFPHILPEVEIIQSDQYYRLYAGPFETAAQATDAAYKVQSSIGLGKPIIVRR